MPLNSLLRDKWVKDAFKNSQITSTTELQVLNSSLSTKKANKTNLHTELTHNHSTCNKRASLAELAQEHNDTIFHLSIRSPKVIKTHCPATVPYTTLTNLSLSSTIEKLKGKKAATVSNINYYLPLTDNFSNRMSALVKQTMKNPGKPFAPQKGTQRGKQPSIENAEFIIQEPCIDPPLPNATGNGPQS